MMGPRSNETSSYLSWLHVIINQLMDIIRELCMLYDAYMDENCEELC